MARQKPLWQRVDEKWRGAKGKWKMPQCHLKEMEQKKREGKTLQDTIQDSFQLVSEGCI